MRILIASNGSMALNDILEFSKQFINSTSEPPTILTMSYNHQVSLERDNSRELALVQIAPKMNMTV